MTAVVGILNKQAVAIAADSAVSVNNKVFNNALKIFTLSKYHPVGVMIYSSASFMNVTPWETIIKMYRKNLGGTPFNTVREYQQNFIEYLRDNNFFVNENDQKVSFKRLFYYILGKFNQNVYLSNRHIFDEPNPTSIPLRINAIDQSIDELLQQLTKTNVIISPEFENYTIEDFNRFLDITFREVIKDIYLQRSHITLSEATIVKLKNLMLTIIRHHNLEVPYTGLVFVGFGEQEIFPSLIPINISFVLETRLKYFVDESQVSNITNEHMSSIRPFAQTEAMDTILSGIAPQLEENYLDNFDAFFKKYNQQITDIIGNNNPQLVQQIQQIDMKRIRNLYSAGNQEIKTKKYIKPLMDAVASLSKEDLAEMAESLIYLTFLQKRITFAKEDVGGDVDVAIISKGDGFIWIKRKHYFKPELNKHFFQNYFNK